VILRALHVVLATTIYLRQPIIDCRFVSPRRCSCVCNGATASACGALDLHDSGQSGLTLSTKKPNMNRDWTAVVNVGRVGVGIATTSGGTRAVTTDVPLHDDARPLGKMPETFAAMVSHALPAPTSSAATALAQHSTPTYPHARARAFIHTHTRVHTHAHTHTHHFFLFLYNLRRPPASLTTRPTASSHNLACTHTASTRVRSIHTACSPNQAKPRGCGEHF
jgi:hypothetical protein